MDVYDDPSRRGYLLRFGQVRKPTMIRVSADAYDESAIAYNDQSRHGCLR